MTGKKFIMLAILFVGLLTVSAVSAEDNITNEKESNEVVSIENEEILQENVLGASPGTFTELANEIAKSKTELILNKDYTYTKGDSAYGIIIDKSIKN